MANQTRWMPFILLLSAACAHEQQTTAPATSAPVVAQAPAVQPAEAAQPAAPPKQTDELARLLSQPISHFSFDQALLSSEDRGQLQALAKALRANPSARIQIAGNCDERGTEEYNLQLGQKRAAVAESYLTRLGVEPARLDTISYGKNRPLEPGHTEQAWAANRRDDASRLPGKPSN